ncbi:MAG: hypothetical protein C0504_11955 [Candidatus Solibacter sp.]|nr:hypothetical protein [Candidatus Solibacter sp.]
MKKLIACGLPLLVAVIIVMQFLGPETANPPEDPAATFAAVAKPPAEVMNVIGRGCRDCHTNRTAWPWYSRIAPASFLVARGVAIGRANLNFSQWRGISPEVTALRMTEACIEVTRGDMPLPRYLPAHPEAKL